MKTIFFLYLLVILPLNAFSQWTFNAKLPYDTAYPPNIRQICVIDSSVSWVCGTTNRNPNPYAPYLAKRSINGWWQITSFDLNPTIQVSAFTARDSSTAWLGTFYPEEIYFTSNGGANWILQAHISDTAFVDGIMFSKKFPNIGYSFADIGHNGLFEGVYILKTTNSGLNWNSWEFDFPDFFCAENSISVIDSNYAWFGLQNLTENTSKLVMTSNGGINWNIIDINNGNYSPISLKFSSDEQTGLYFYVNNTTRIYRTTNSGFNWTPIFTINSYFFPYAMKWVIGTSNIYADDENTVIHSIDNGITWSQMTGINSSVLISLDAIKINNGTIYALALDQYGMIYRLLDTARVIGIEQLGTTLPKKFSLSQNYPNPFNPSTKIDFDLPKDENVTIEIYDMLGRVVEILAKNELKRAGSYQVNWNASNFSSGVYFYRLEARQVGSSTGDYVTTKKMVLIK